MPIENKEEFKPKIVAFCCNWCSSGLLKQTDFSGGRCNMPIENKEEFKPKIVAFCCNWCSYAGADLAGSSRLSYPADVKIAVTGAAMQERILQEAAVFPIRLM